MLIIESGAIWLPIFLLILTNEKIKPNRFSHIQSHCGPGKISNLPKTCARLAHSLPRLTTNRRKSGKTSPRPSIAQVFGPEKHAMKVCFSKPKSSLHWTLVQISSTRLKLCKTSPISWACK